MCLPNDHWLAPKVKGPSWLTEQTPNVFIHSESSDVESFLNNNFCLNFDERVYYVLMREQVYSLPISLFTSHWSDFLFLGDESPFLFHPETKAFACFGPNGDLTFGKKS